MAHLIDKDTLVTEIERIKKEECPTDSYEGRCKLFWLEQFLSFINTLEVKEVDLKKEYEEYVVDDPIFGNFITNDTMGMKLAKHFFELGISVSNKEQKGEKV